MLTCVAAFSCPPPPPPEVEADKRERKKSGGTLNDFFVSSPSPPINNRVMPPPMPSMEDDDDNDNEDSGGEMQGARIASIPGDNVLNYKEQHLTMIRLPPPYDYQIPSGKSNEKGEVIFKHRLEGKQFELSARMFLMFFGLILGRLAVSLYAGSHTHTFFQVRCPME